MRAARLGSSVYRTIYSNGTITQKFNIRTLAGKKFNYENELHEAKSLEQIDPDDYKYHQSNRVKNSFQNNQKDIVLKSAEKYLVENNEKLFIKDDKNQRTKNKHVRDKNENAKKYKSNKHVDVEENSNLIVENDPDTFGLLNKTHAVFSQKYDQDEDDKKEEKFISELPVRSQKRTIGQYSHLIKFHLGRNQIKEALDVLEIEMLNTDRVQPTNYIYNLLIYGCARVGYTKKAFMLFNDMKRRGLKPTGATYTSLFNVCSNSPWKEDGLKRAIDLQKLLAEKMIEPNIANYNAMMKAFGRCGDLVRAFSVIDEMIHKNMKIRVHNFNFLLHGCITDKEAGFRHALIVWRKMLKLREKPNIFTFKLITRCASECKLGNDELEKSFLKKLEIKPKPQYYIKSKNDVKKEDSSLEVVKIANDANALVKHNMPNFLSPVPHMGDVVSLNKIVSAEDRFMLIGGIDGLLEEVDRYQVVPDILLFSQILDAIPNTPVHDEKVLNYITKYKVRPKISFYNHLIKRRCFRFDYEGAKNVISLIETENKKYKKNFLKRKLLIKPDIMTYGALALACIKKQDAEELINEMLNKRTRPNSEIMGTLIKSAFISKDFEYVKYIIDMIIEEKIPINHIAKNHFTKNLGRMLTKVKTLQNSGKELTKEDKQLMENFEELKRKKAILLKEDNVDNLEEEGHPWSQFRVNRESSFQYPFEKPYKPRLYKKKPRKHVKYVVKM